MYIVALQLNKKNNMHIYIYILYIYFCLYRHIGAEGKIKKMKTKILKRVLKKGKRRIKWRNQKT